MSTKHCGELNPSQRRPAHTYFMPNPLNLRLQRSRILENQQRVSYSILHGCRTASLHGTHFRSNRRCPGGHLPVEGMQQAPEPARLVMAEWPADGFCGQKARRFLRSKSTTGFAGKKHDGFCGQKARRFLRATTPRREAPVGPEVRRWACPQVPTRLPEAEAEAFRPSRAGEGRGVLGPHRGAARLAGRPLADPPPILEGCGAPMRCRIPGDPHAPRGGAQRAAPPRLGSRGAVGSAGIRPRPCRSREAGIEAPPFRALWRFRSRRRRPAVLTSGPGGAPSESALPRPSQLCPVRVSSAPSESARCVTRIRQVWIQRCRWQRWR